MIGFLADLEAKSATGNRTQNSMNVARIARVKKHEEASVVILQPSVDLNGQPVGFLALKIVVVNPDVLTRDEFVRVDRHAIRELQTEERPNGIAKRGKAAWIDQRCQGLGQ